MVSCAPSTQALNYTHMNLFQSKNSSREIDENSIFGYIDRTPEFSKFKAIIKRAKLVGQLQDIQANCTILVPRDEDLSNIPKEYLNNMDVGLARHIVTASIINNKIDRYLITSSPVTYLYTRNPDMRMYVENIGMYTRINNCAVVREYDLKCTNGIIHVVSNLIVPNEDTFIN